MPTRRARGRRASHTCRNRSARRAASRASGARAASRAGITRDGRARARARRRRALLRGRAAASVTRLPIFLIFACELLELGRGMARLERIVSLIVVSHVPKYKRDVARRAHFHRAPTSNLTLLMPYGRFHSGGEDAPTPPRRSRRTFAGRLAREQASFLN